MDGLAMDAPSSGIISEIFLQHIEHTHHPRLTQKHKLVNYFRYVDDILMIYDSLHTDIQAILHDFNSIHPRLLFTQETEHNNAINYLDITIHKTRLISKSPSTENPLSQTPSYHTLQTTPPNKNKMHSDSYTTA
jgi:hypothetical protein